MSLVALVERRRIFGSGSRGLLFNGDIKNAAEWIMISFALYDGFVGFNTAKLKVKTDIFGILSKIGRSKWRFAV